MTPTTQLARIRATQDLQRGEYISPHQVLADTPRVNLCAWHDDEEFYDEVRRVAQEGAR